MPAPQPLSAREIQVALAELTGWTFAENCLEREYTFAGHLAAAAVVMEIARLQDRLDHHADLTLGYTTVKVAVNTHSVGGKVTELDIDLARHIEQIAEEHQVT
ncbi:4a-hydroxytetrahydrobiopterin dehydratase [Streptomyces zingiberis]|uniref:Putative pterin-4-alpha-carbinolamine dehydratase n=1 Tax=Streptomyces zingiberis TaxID=2053010 RepID=A0ABX1BZ09_9ACTN|nr:4a-hydroxytetrahydrobiopterin dehydratase [Streptomyces zingiberis]NJQ02871.1 4a-hydroxytetrahydrobiopterin dehydratase [Streptomyces zingiberis]